MKHSTLHSMKRMVVALAAVGLTAGFTGAASAASAEKADAARLTEMADGTLLVYRADTVIVTPVRYAHQPDLVASNCLNLESRWVSAASRMPALVNRCSYPVTVSYCSDGSHGSNGACAAVGHRKLEAHRIEPGVAMRLDQISATAEEVFWVACRSTRAGVMSTLIENGTLGECLGEEPGQKIAAQSSATPTLLARSK